MATRTSSLQNVNALGDRTVLQYNAAEDRFKLVSVDDILDTAAEDGNISDAFIDRVEEEISVENLQLLGLDGGSF
jgi:hypothetical protein